MKTTKDLETSILHVASDLTGASRPFRQIWGGVAWGNPKLADAVYADHALVIAGEQEDGRINALCEFSGKYPALLQEMVRLKDDLLVSWFWAPKAPVGLFTKLYEVDGLTRYFVRGWNPSGQPIYAVPEPQEQWSTFRGWDVVASVGPYADALEVDFEAARLRVDALVKDKSCLLNYKRMPRVEKAQGQGADASDMPIFRALVGVVWALDEQRQARLARQQSKQDGASLWPEEYEIRG